MVKVRYGDLEEKVIKTKRIKGVVDWKDNGLMVVVRECVYQYLQQY